MKCIPGKGYMTLEELRHESKHDRDKRHAAMRKEDAENRRQAKMREQVQVAKENLAKAVKYAQALRKNPQVGVVAVERRELELERVLAKAERLSLASIGARTKNAEDPELVRKRRELLNEAVRRELAHRKGIRVC